MFSSTHPEDLGHRPRTKDEVRPGLCSCGQVYLTIGAHWMMVQHNAPNPILVFLRDYWADRMHTVSMVAQMVLNLLNERIVVEEYTQREREHAERVLRRLIALDNQEARV